MIFLLNGQEFIQLADLCQSYCCMQFRYAIVVTKKGMKVCPAVNAFVIVTMIAITIAFYISGFIISEHGATFGTGDRFYEVKRKSAGISDGAEVFAFIGGADA